MKIAVAGTGYVGLVTGASLAFMGHDVTCVDVDEAKVSLLKSGKSPIYEEGLEDLMHQSGDRLQFTSAYAAAYAGAQVIIIGVGTPEMQDGSANLDFVYKVGEQIADSVSGSVVVVVKSTVPIGTNDELERYILERLPEGVRVDVVSNPEFLAQGSAVKDTLYASRIAVGAETDFAKEVMREMYEPFTKDPYNVPYLEMGRRSAEMLKYASNDFLALKISYINEISNFCEAVGADIEEVTRGMGLDERIGGKFLKSGIGYGGSCFPKDTKALHWLSRQHDSELKTVRATIEVNTAQKIALFKKLKDDTKNLKGLKVAVLGLTFKPGTDDVREAPSLDIVQLLLDYGVEVTAFDPVGTDNFKRSFPSADKVTYKNSVNEAITDADAVMILTEWDEIKQYPLEKFSQLTSDATIYDGRNCYELKDAHEAGLKYVSMGRPRVS